MKLTQDIHKAAAEALAHQPVTIPRAQYEAYRQAAWALEAVNDKYPTAAGQEVLAALRAVGVER